MVILLNTEKTMNSSGDINVRNLQRKSLGFCDHFRKSRNTSLENLKLYKG